MGLDDMADEASEDTPDFVEEQEREEIEQMKEELGIKDREDLEQLQGRIQTIAELVITMDKRLEDMERQVNSLVKIIQSMVDSEQEGEDDGGDWDWET